MSDRCQIDAGTTSFDCKHFVDCVDCVVLETPVNASVSEADQGRLSNKMDHLVCGV